ncbi:MAG: PEP-CTERM-box response regulator transcription factor [Candidatus Tectomicrobia bacterium]|uniref:PEP-CTERM-box response regulator transcription factor n=1 Tax=Tectimicrobiota bacterium TaxID=2528274 RepID=A0A932CQ04_UNCTE|nr:PEP-CTERM-box response regulator transcription factor [Candidatus Tectomicrobia bacterium]
MEKPKILIVDDDEEILRQMRWALKEEHEVFLASDRTEALRVFRQERPPVVALDLGLPPQPTGVQEGFQALQEILALDPLTKVIIITGNAEREKALWAIQEGAHDYYAKPIVVEELQVILRRALHLYRLEAESLPPLQREIRPEDFPEILGSSPEMRKVLALIKKVAPTQVSVLITGESGTGKELVARAIHRYSPRRDRPFVAINCGAIPETLLESELFGHEKGAFTGAHIQRRGQIERAQEGTLFLDEVGDLPLPLQVKLLRFLQEHQLERVGGREPIAIDVRVLAATHLDLKQAMAEGRFREDLYYRLGVVTMALPSLRERGEDILLLAQALLQCYVAESQRKITGFTPRAMAALQAYRWPGNVRELENRIKRAVIVAEGAHLTPADLELASSYARYEGRSLREAREALEREFVQRALVKSKGNITRAATDLGISRPTLHELMAKYAIGH